MNYRLTDDKFYVTIAGIDGPVGNIREESELLARTLSADSNKILLSISSGLDSQIMLHSFAAQDLPYACSFLYSPGYNDIEFDQLKILENKYGFKSIIVELDHIKLKYQIIWESEKHKIQCNQIYQKIYLSKLPEEYDFIQAQFSCYTYVTEDKKLKFFQGYNSTTISRDRSFNLLNRQGKHLFFGEITGNQTRRVGYSMLASDIYTAALTADRYFNMPLNGYNRWNIYIKPLLYAKYWGDELEYFPKLTGIENIEYLNTIGWWHEHGTFIPLFELLENMRLNCTVEYAENYHRPDRNTHS